MLNRRAFIGAAGCSLLTAGVSRHAFGQPRSWICGTIDGSRSDLDGTGLMARYAAETGSNFQTLEGNRRESGITPYGTAYFWDRWLRSDGLTPNTGVITLGVHFLNGTEGQKAVVRRAASAWLAGELGTRMRFAFDVPRHQAQITVNLNSDRNNSIVGRASATYAPSYATMNLYDLVDHIVMHEFGHAIGLQHEHQHPSLGIQWNESTVIAAMAQQGWSEEMVRANIFARFNQHYACVGNPGFDPQSVMLYPIPAGWAANITTGTNATISQGDRNCVVGLYRV